MYKNILSGLCGAVLASILVVAPASAAIITKVVDYKQGDQTFKGYLAYDDAVQGKVPGILVVHEWWGLNDFTKAKAVEVAKLGYVAFAVDMYGDGKTTTDPKVAGEWASAVKGTSLIRQRSQVGLHILRENEHVDPARLGAIGFCFGGTTVLELAYSGVDVKGVVTFHGGLVSPKPEDMSRIKSAFLVLHGANDTFVKPEEIAGFRQAMKEANTDWQMNYFSGAVHAFTNPDADKFGIPGVAYNAKAAQRSWQAMTDFFKEIFSQ